MARVAVRLFCDNHRHGRHSGVGVVATLGTIAIVSHPGVFDLRSGHACAKTCGYSFRSTVFLMSL
jgi:hypothetical protein